MKESALDIDVEVEVVYPFTSHDAALIAAAPKMADMLEMLLNGYARMFFLASEGDLDTLKREIDTMTTRALAVLRRADGVVEGPLPEEGSPLFGLSVKTFRILQRTGMLNEERIRAADDAEMLAVRGIGSHALAEIRGVLE